MLNQTILKEELYYNYKTGEFTRLKNLPGQYRIGDTAGGFSKEGYVLIRVRKKQYKGHRLAWLYMTGELLNSHTHIDHIDGNRANNKWENLRIATKSENGLNRGKNKNNTSGTKGIYFENGRFPRLIALFTFEGKVYRKTIRLTWNTREEAEKKLILWLKNKREEIQGEFANHG